MGNVTEHFFSKLRASFVVPQNFETAAFIAELDDALGGYSDHQLSEAARWIKYNRTHRTFPTIAECRQACERFSAVPSPRMSAEFKSDEEKRSDAIRQRIRERDAILLCRDAPLAEQAHREGWLQTLLEFVEDRGTLPNELEARRLKAKSAAVDANLHSLKPKFMPDAVGYELERLKEEAKRYKAFCDCRQSMKDRVANRLWGQPAVDVASDRRRAMSDRFDEFKRRFG